jgi:hypothetical protein
MKTYQNPPITGSVDMVSVGRYVMALFAALFWVLTPSSPQAAVFTVVPSADPSVAIIHLGGRIIEGDRARLEQTVGRAGKASQIVLLVESPGGQALEAFSIGRYLHQQRIITVAIEGPGCYSGCAYIFLGGKSRSGKPGRIMMKGARIGFHQASVALGQGNYTAAQVNGAMSAGQDLARMTTEYLRDVSADSEFLSMALAARPNEFKMLNEIDALRLGIPVMDGLSNKLLPASGGRSSVAKN